MNNMMNAHGVTSLRATVKQEFVLVTFKHITFDSHVNI